MTRLVAELPTTTIHREELLNLGVSQKAPQLPAFCYSRKTKELLKEMQEPHHWLIWRDAVLFDPNNEIIRFTDLKNTIQKRVFAYEYVASIIKQTPSFEKIITDPERQQKYIGGAYHLTLKETQRTNNIPQKMSLTTKLRRLGENILFFHKHASSVAEGKIGVHAKTTLQAFFDRIQKLRKSVKADSTKRPTDVPKRNSVIIRQSDSPPRPR